MANNVTLPPQGSGQSNPVVSTAILDDNSHVQQVQLRDVLEPTRYGRRSIIFRERFNHPQLGMYNDGAGGSAHRDCEIMFNDLPSCRLDPQGTTTNLTDPQNSPITNGVVLKRRIVNIGSGAATGRYSWSGWIKWTSQNNTTNVYTTASVYNRDGTNQNGFRVWFDTITTANHMLVKVFDQASGLWQQIYDYNIPLANHAYDPINSPAIPDVAGMWNYFRMVVDFDTGRYVTVQINEVLVDASAYTMISLLSSGARALHFSIEYSQKTSTRRFINIANLIGAQESA